MTKAQTAYHKKPRNIILTLGLLAILTLILIVTVVQTTSKHRTSLNSKAAGGWCSNDNPNGECSPGQICDYRSDIGQYTCVEDVCSESNPTGFCDPEIWGVGAYCQQLGQYRTYGCAGGTIDKCATGSNYSTGYLLCSQEGKDCDPLTGSCIDNANTPNTGECGANNGKSWGTCSDESACLHYGNYYDSSGYYYCEGQTTNPPPSTGGSTTPSTYGTCTTDTVGQKCSTSNQKDGECRTESDGTPTCLEIPTTGDDSLCAGGCGANEKCSLISDGTYQCTLVASKCSPSCNGDEKCVGYGSYYNTSASCSCVAEKTCDPGYEAYDSNGYGCKDACRKTETLPGSSNPCEDNPNLCSAITHCVNDSTNENGYRCDCNNGAQADEWGNCNEPSTPAPSCDDKTVDYCNNSCPSGMPCEIFRIYQTTSDTCSNQSITEMTCGGNPPSQAPGTCADGTYPVNGKCITCGTNQENINGICYTKFPCEAGQQYDADKDGWYDPEVGDKCCPVGVSPSAICSNTAPSSDAPKCGDGKLQAGELCDGAQFIGNASCATLNMQGNILCLNCIPVPLCYPKTTTSGPVAQCGNNKREGTEVCDGTDVGITCVQAGFVNTTGKPTCKSDCKGYDTKVCQTATTTPPTSTTCAKKAQGDANCNDIVSVFEYPNQPDNRYPLTDYQIWKGEYTGKYTTKRADFNNDGKVDFTDYEIWRINAVTQNACTNQ